MNLTVNLTVNLSSNPVSKPLSHFQRHNKHVPSRSQVIATAQARARGRLSQSARGRRVPNSQIPLNMGGACGAVWAESRADSGASVIKRAVHISRGHTHTHLHILLGTAHCDPRTPADTSGHQGDTRRPHGHTLPEDHAAAADTALQH